MFNSALRNVFLPIVSVSKEVGGSEFTILSSEFESFKILVNCVNIFDVSFRKYFKHASINHFLPYFPVDLNISC